MIIFHTINYNKTIIITIIDFFISNISKKDVYLIVVISDAKAIMNDNIKYVLCT